MLACSYDSPCPYPAFYKIPCSYSYPSCSYLLQYSTVLVRVLLLGLLMPDDHQAEA